MNVDFSKIVELSHTMLPEKEPFMLKVNLFDVNDLGERFMPAIHPDAELAPRDVDERPELVHSDLPNSHRAEATGASAAGAWHARVRGRCHEDWMVDPRRGT